MKLIRNLEEKAINYIFTISKRPVLYRDLLRANASFNEGMLVDPSILNFRVDIAKSYFLYTLVCAFFLIPGVYLTHKIFVNIDFHLSIIGTIITTSLVFLGFQIFQNHLRNLITSQLLQKAWQMHFPHFPYEKYNQKVEKIYGEMVKNEIPKKEWEKYVIDKLVESN
ncbi:MAG: hypothetical protein M0P02_00680 [Sulfurospirillaceae bacterium]|nr:hypothetical protein [Sulfurospirillaceae bacterium]MCK9545580.1 hypothetical protein [Sulfurospirillaceae bacterium]NLN00228.1 hypothetical protein [Campylobacteraceae bacterium]